MAQPTLTPLRLTGVSEDPITVESVRPMTEADVALMQAPRGFSGTQLSRLTQRHHSLARMIASGMKPGEAAVAAGYTASSVSLICTDPSFKELVNFYQQEVTDEYLSAHRAMANTMLDGVDLLSLHLQKDVERVEAGVEPQLSPTKVLEIVTALADRTGHGVSSVTTTVQVDMATRMRERREAAMNASRDIEGEARRA